MCRSRFLALAACLLTASACTGPQGSSVPVNTGDTTPPVVFSLETLGRQGGDLHVTETSGAVSGTLAASDSIQVAARGDDSEGVRQVAIWGTTTKTCTDPSGNATREGPGLAGAPLADSTDTAAPGGTTTIQRVVSVPLRLADYSCQAGSRLALEFDFWVTAQNFGGGTAQSEHLTLTFNQP
jgi:hypothetical protein